MMTLFLTYELKVAVLIAVFYIFWRLLVANETWHRLNRIVLLSTAIASFVLPFCVITIHQTIEVVPTVMEQMPVLMPEEEITMPSEVLPVITGTEVEQPFNWQLLLTIIYIIGVLVVLSKMLLSLWRLHRMTIESEIHPLPDGLQIAVIDKVKTPFSWWKTVFLNHQDFEEGLQVDDQRSGIDTTALLTHELGHIRLYHSADVLLVELLTALQWFNPAMWMLRNDLRTIHEYEADQQVLSHGFNDIRYLQLLIRKAASQSGYSLANGISNSVLKKRVTMMMKPKSNQRQWIRYAYLLPIITISLAMSAKIQKEEVLKSGSEESAIRLVKKDGKDYYGVKAPAGAFFTWLVNGHLAERSMIKEDGNWNVLSLFSPTEYYISLNTKPISIYDIPYIPFNSIKEVKLIQDDYGRREIELYTQHRTEFNRDTDYDYPADYKENVKAWIFFRAEEAATGRQMRGVEVTVVETGQKAKTNEEGWCELKVPLGTTVKASYPGYESETYKINHINGNEVQGWTFWMSKPGDKIYRNVSKQAEFIGDKERWIAKNTQLRKAAAGGKGVSGRVTVWLVVNEDGSVSGVRLKQGFNHWLNNEAIRLVSSMPRWKPALKDGKPVKSLTLTSVSFENVQDRVLIGAFIRDEKSMKYMNDVDVSIMSLDRVVLAKPMLQEVYVGSQMYRYVWDVPRRDRYIIKVSKQGYNTEYKTISIKDRESQNIPDDIILRKKLVLGS